MARLTDDIVYIEISEMDYLLICFIRDLRTRKGLTQLQLSQRMKLADGFVSKVETFTERAKYSIRHLPLLASALECEIKDFFPKLVPKYDQIQLTIKRTNRTNKDGSLSSKKFSEVINIEPVTKK
jgi:transcriptional regulator with XRE-family HTH domain